MSSKKSYAHEEERSQKSKIASYALNALFSLPFFRVSCISGWSRIHYVAGNDLELMPLLPPLPKSWDSRYVPLCLALRAQIHTSIALKMSRARDNAVC